MWFSLLAGSFTCSFSLERERSKKCTQAFNVCGSDIYFQNACVSTDFFFIIIMFTFKRQIILLLFFGIVIAFFSVVVSPENSLCFRLYGKNVALSNVNGDKFMCIELWLCCITWVSESLCVCVRLCFIRETNRQAERDQEQDDKRRPNKLSSGKKTRETKFRVFDKTHIARLLDYRIEQ